MGRGRVVDILDLISDRMADMEASGRCVKRLLIGHREAAELEAALYRQAKTWRGLLGEVIAEDSEFAPKLPYPLTKRVLLFDVPVERVDQDTLLGVVGA